MVIARRVAESGALVRPGEICFIASLANRIASSLGDHLRTRNCSPLDALPIGTGPSSRRTRARDVGLIPI
jgi:hypothetical protein